ncbi:MAG: GNAT family N-acetyltransferase, partial [Pseudomonadota bacterium]|nr:GNAT family N-acetyltransferase [Pseudomonadota bacterium]
MSDAIKLRPYQAADEDAAIDLWLRGWQAAYPELDFASRLDWWRARWRNELVAAATIIVAEGQAGIIGFVTVDPRNGYLDQLVVAPEAWGSGLAATLMTKAKALAPAGLELQVNQDNTRASRFYSKQGFTIVGESVNPQ